ncbi:hypothetical protein KP696_19885 [Nocardia seriolae]|nr:hypothetical protein [Nocardia seriolae]MTJ71532.1 hypothetical protein [Nocardia seriolae]MTJ90891.1 hypothetical protein [Nocardia seriolae]MTK34848.1 hypothetical protein [Nocardia seriolae]MTK38954.1 hypothetical protein [Nocardia seriolae]
MLAHALEGRGVRTHTGLDLPTRTALRVIARAYPDVAEELVEAARETFAGQLDGTNSARRRAELDRKLEEAAERLNGSRADEVKDEFA